MLLPLLPQPTADAAAVTRRPPPMARVPGFLRFAPSPTQGTAETVVQVVAADTGLFTDTADTVSLDAAAVAKRRPPPSLRAPGLLRFAPAPPQGVGNTITATDTGSNADTATLATALTAADTAVGIDTATLAVDLAAADTGTSVDVATVDMGAGYAPPPQRPPPMLRAPGMLRFAPAPAQGVSGLVQVAAADTGAGTDTATLTTALTATDTGVGTDTGSLAAGIPASDTSSGVDTASLAVAVPAADNGTGVDTGTILIVITAPPMVMRPPPMMRGPMFLRFAPSPPQGVPAAVVMAGTSTLTYPGGPGSSPTGPTGPASAGSVTDGPGSLTAALTGPASLTDDPAGPTSKGV